MTGRVCKLLLTAGMALYFTLVAFGNLTDYDTNFRFVQHVMSMDSIFPDSTLQWRAITSPLLHRLFYAAIIAWEATAAILCWLGVIQLGRALHADASRFARAKRVAMSGLVVGCLLWLVAFLCVGGEWFAMWQSPTWNGQTVAFRMFTVNGIVLLVLLQPDAEGR